MFEDLSTITQDFRFEPWGGQILCDNDSGHNWAANGVLRLNTRDLYPHEAGKMAKTRAACGRSSLAQSLNAQTLEPVRLADTTFVRRLNENEGPYASESQDGSMSRMSKLCIPGCFLVWNTSIRNAELGGQAS